MHTKIEICIKYVSKMGKNEAAERQYDIQTGGSKYFPYRLVLDIKYVCLL